MMKTFRVAARAAAAALLCALPAAAAAQLGQPGIAATLPPATLHAAARTQIASGDVDPETAAVTPLPFTATPTPVLTHARAGAVPISQPTVVPPAPAAPFSSTIARPTAGRTLGDLVSEHAGANPSDEQFECLARAVYFESRGEPLEGQLAVAEVILNRVRSGRFRSTICNVVTQPSQFSFVRGGRIPEVPRAAGAWHRAVAIAHIALQELHDVTGNDSLFFHAAYVSPNWGRPRIARIGNHIFYR